MACRFCIRFAKWGWLCPWLAIFLVAVLLSLWGLTWWSALLAALLLACPAIILWGLWSTREERAALPPAPHTKGMTLNWAAPMYEWYCPKIGLGSTFRARTMGYAAIQADNRVLEAGCGTGVLTRLAARLVGPSGMVAGIDPAPGMIAVARRNAAREGVTAEFKLAVIENLPYPDESFDVVLASLMLHHLPPEVKREGLSEVFRVLRPGGRLVVADLDRPAYVAWWLVVWPLLLFPMTADNLSGRIPDFLRGAGFSGIELAGRWGGLLAFWVAHKV